MNADTKSRRFKANSDKTGNFRKDRFHPRGEQLFLFNSLKYQCKSASKCFLG